MKRQKMSSKWQIKLSYVAMCIDLNEIFLLFSYMRILQQEELSLVCFTMLIHDHKTCMSVIDLSCTVLGIPVTTFFFSWLYWNWFTVNQASIVIHKLFTFLCLLILLSCCWICSFLGLFSMFWCLKHFTYCLSWEDFMK